VLGNKPIPQITRSELLVELKKIEAKGLLETARRMKQRCGKRPPKAAALALKSAAIGAHHQ